MPRLHKTPKFLPVGLILALPLLGPACAGENAATEEPPPLEMALDLPENEAGAALAAALTEAGATERHVFVHTGADW